jgi:hypothetical protein
MHSMEPSTWVLVVLSYWRKVYLQLYCPAPHLPHQQLAQRGVQVEVPGELIAEGHCCQRPQVTGRSCGGACCLLSPSRPMQLVWL